MNKPYFLTQAAEDDLKQIILYTLKTWGLEQVHKYQTQLNTRIRAIVAFPDIGRKHPKLAADIYYISEGKHYIFYKKDSEGIEILRFLHHQMDIISHLSDEL